MTGAADSTAGTLREDEATAASLATGAFAPPTVGMSVSPSIRGGLGRGTCAVWLLCCEVAGGVDLTVDTGPRFSTDGRVGGSRGGSLGGTVPLFRGTATTTSALDDATAVGLATGFFATNLGGISISPRSLDVRGRRPCAADLMFGDATGRVGINIDTGPRCSSNGPADGSHAGSLG